MTKAITLCESNNEIRIEWRINNFFIREDNLIISPHFILFNSEWFFMLHLGDIPVLPIPQRSNVFREPLRMSILTPYSKTEHHIEYRMGIERSDGSEIRTDKYESLLKPGFSQMPQRHELISRKEFENFRDSLVPANTLKVFCIVRLLRVINRAKSVTFRTLSTSSFGFPPSLIFRDETQMAGDITLDESNNETRIVWSINDFFNRNDCLIESPPFIFFKARWLLQIHKFSFSLETIDPWSFLRMSLQRAYDKAEHYIEYRMGIQRSDGSEITTEKCESVLQSGCSLFTQEQKIISRKDFEKSRDKLVPGNYLKVFCIVRLLNDNNSAEETSFLERFSFSTMSFGSILGEIILSQSKNETRIDWMINHFFQRETTFMKSPNFRIFKSDWYLEIGKYTKSPSLFKSHEVSENSLHLLLHRDCYSTAEHYIEYKMGILKPDGTEVITETFESVFQPRFAKIIQMRELISGKDFESLRQTLAHGTTLKVFCTIRLLSYENPADNDPSTIASTHVSGPRQQINQVTPVIDSSPICGSSQNEPHATGSSHEQDTSTSFERPKDVCICKGNHTLSENFEALYRSKRLTDVTITVKNKTFYAHKLILSTRSDAFASMFGHDTSEERSGIVEITDCDHDSFENFLLYLYAGKLDTVSPSNAASIYKTADKYGVKELKDECFRCMSQEMTVDTFCDLFHLAVLHGESDLLATATSFFVRNASAVLITKEWMTLLEEHPSLCNELLVKFAKSGLQK